MQLFFLILLLSENHPVSQLIRYNNKINFQSDKKQEIKMISRNQKKNRSSNW